jgi:hypothetical protein
MGDVTRLGQVPVGAPMVVGNPVATGLLQHHLTAHPRVRAVRIADTDASLETA